MLLREPVERAFSAWNMFRTLRHEQPDYLRRLLPECDPMLQDSLSRMLARDSFPAVRRGRSGRSRRHPRPEARRSSPATCDGELYHEQLRRLPEVLCAGTAPDPRQRSAQEGSDRGTRPRWSGSWTSRPTGGRRRIFRSSTSAVTSTRSPRRLARSSASSIDPTTTSSMTLLGRDFGW